ncbi:MAG: alanine racemase [Bacteroidia bacterium]|nr:alanine racemase [Bacteroidia bacterium]
MIDDSYNNDLSGLRISLDFLAGQHQKKRKILILSDILQSGLEDSLLVTRIAELVNNSGIDKVVGIGKQLQQHAGFFTMPSQFFADTDAFLHAIRRDDFHDAVILLKGARRFRFEKILAVLQRKVHGTVMEINLDAMVHNLNYIRSLLLPSTKMMVMVKAFAYGSGSAEVANLLQYHKVDYLGVAYADEGIELRKHNITLPVLVMNPSAESFASIQHYHLEPEIYSFRILHALIDFLKGEKIKIHLKIDTGMHRLGFDAGQLEELTRLLAATPNLHVASVFSHLSGADDQAHDDFTKSQAQQFMRIAESIAGAIGYKPLFHILNSPGLLRHTQWQLDMVRLGIGLYGIDPTSGQHPLKPVATLKTVVSQIKEIAAGETIGYGRKGKADAHMRTATIALGYADGFGRVFSNGVGKVLVNGKLAPVVGNVCMDMTMVDVSGIDVQEGDEVVIFGDELPIADVAQWANTIPYEILTNTSERVKRVFVAESI